MKIYIILLIIFVGLKTYSLEYGFSYGQSLFEKNVINDYTLKLSYDNYLLNFGYGKNTEKNFKSDWSEDIGNKKASQNSYFLGAGLKVYTDIYFTLQTYFYSEEEILSGILLDDKTIEYDVETENRMILTFGLEYMFLKNYGLYLKYSPRGHLRFGFNILGDFSFLGKNQKNQKWTKKELKFLKEGFGNISAWEKDYVDMLLKVLSISKSEKRELEEYLKNPLNQNRSFVLFLLNLPLYEDLKENFSKSSHHSLAKFIASEFKLKKKRYKRDLEYLIVYFQSSYDKFYKKEGKGKKIPMNGRSSLLEKLSFFTNEEIIF